MDGFIIAKIFHILGVVFWIGGVAMVTTVILPAVKKFKSLEERVEFNRIIRLLYDLEIACVEPVPGCFILVDVGNGYCLVNIHFNVVCY